MKDNKGVVQIMTIPDYQSLLLPFLKHLSNGKEHTKQEMIDLLATDFKLTSAERKELLPSGRQKVFDNRVSWTRTYLKKALLLQSPARGRYTITDRGRQVLTENLSKIDVSYLKQFPEFVTFLNTSKNNNKTPVNKRVARAESKDTPEEILEASYQILRHNLAQELLSKVIECSPAFFENLVVELLLKMGYGGSRKDAGQAIGKTGDGGIDGIIKEDRLGLDVVYIQAKRWEGTVSRPEIQKFVGALQGKKARKGIFITSGFFSSYARDYVKDIQNSVVLIDGEELSSYMIDFGVGVSPLASYEIMSIDSDYFMDEQ
ncbi:MAG: restriction endonuclease [Aminobacterium colombiense]|nr:restriction endonuclease [Aminobacterium colombiense]